MPSMYFSFVQPIKSENSYSVTSLEPFFKNLYILMQIAEDSLSNSFSEYTPFIYFSSYMQPRIRIAFFVAFLNSVSNTYANC